MNLIPWFHLEFPLLSKPRVLWFRALVLHHKHHEQQMRIFWNALIFTTIRSSNCLSRTIFHIRLQPWDSWFCRESILLDRTSQRKFKRLLSYLERSRIMSWMRINRMLLVVMSQEDSFLFSLALVHHLILLLLPFSPSFLSLVQVPSLVFLLSFVLSCGVLHPSCDDVHLPYALHVKERGMTFSKAIIFQAHFTSVDLMPHFHKILWHLDIVFLHFPPKDIYTPQISLKQQRHQQLSNDCRPRMSFLLSAFPKCSLSVLNLLLPCVIFRDRED